MIKGSSVDLCYLTESWLKQNNHDIFDKICDHGLDIFSAPRQGKGVVLHLCLILVELNLKKIKLEIFII